MQKQREIASEKDLDGELEDISILDQNDFEFIIKRLDQIIRNYNRMKNNIGKLEDQMTSLLEKDRLETISKDDADELEELEAIEEEGEAPLEIKEAKKEDVSQEVELEEVEEAEENKTSPGLETETKIGT